MLIAKISRNLVRRNLGEEETYTIIDPMTFLDDVFTDLSLENKIEPVIRKLYDDIFNMDTLVAGSAPVISIANKGDNVKLTKADIKRLPDGSDIGGLGNVDNTPDDTKEPSNPLKSRWDDYITNYIKPSYDSMMLAINAYRRHVNTNGAPIRTNPHLDTLEKGVWYNGHIVQLHPETFINISVVENALRAHNSTTNITQYHTNIWDRIREYLNGIYNPGDVTYDANALSQRYQQYLANLPTRINAIATDPLMGIPVHVNDTSAACHPNLRSAVADELARVSDIHNYMELPQYEYIAWKKDVLDPDEAYTKEYPTVYGVINLIRALPKGFATTNTSRPAISAFSSTPYLRLETASRRMTLLATDGTYTTWNHPPPLPRYKIRYFETTTDTTFPDSPNNWDGPVIALMKKLKRIIWRSHGELATVPWKYFNLNLGPEDSPRIITGSSYYYYDPLYPIPNGFKDVIKNEFHNFRTALIFTPNAITVYRDSSTRDELNSRISGAVSAIQATPGNGKVTGPKTDQFFVKNTDESANNQYQYLNGWWVKTTNTPISDAYVFEFSFIKPPGSASANEMYKSVITAVERRLIWPMLFRTSFITIPYNTEPDRRILAIITPTDRATADTTNIRMQSSDYYKDTVIPPRNISFEGDVGHPERPPTLYSTNRTGTGSTELQGRHVAQSISLTNMAFASMTTRINENVVKLQADSYVPPVPPATVGTYTKTQGAITTAFFVINTDTNTKYNYNGTSWAVSTSTTNLAASTFSFSFSNPPVATASTNRINWSMSFTRTAGTPLSTYRFTHQNSGGAVNMRCDYIYT